MYAMTGATTGRADLFEEVHGHASVPDASHLVGGHEALPVTAEPVTCTGLVVLHPHGPTHDTVCIFWFGTA